MNSENMTKKSIEGLNAAVGLAKENGNQEVGQLHLLSALVGQADGLIPGLLKGMGVSAENLKAKADEAVSRLPKVSGGGDNYLSNGLRAALDAAEKQAREMKDEYVSVEHLFYGLIEKAEDGVKKLLSDAGVSKDSFMKALMQVRGNVRVTGDSPEDTYDVLNKYGADLVERARENRPRHRA